MININIFDIIKLQFYNGGCYVTAKRINTITIKDIPYVGLQTKSNKRITIYPSKVLNFSPYDPLPPNYKLNYGIRICGYHESTKTFLFYGFDLFYQVTGNGLNLEDFLNFCLIKNFNIDWYNFQRTSIERELWSISTLFKKISYPIIEVYGKDYWENLKYRLRKYEWSILPEGDLKEQYRCFFN